MLLPHRESNPRLSSPQPSNCKRQNMVSVSKFVHRNHSLASFTSFTCASALLLHHTTLRQSFPYRAKKVTVIWPVFGLVALLVAARARHKNTQNRQLGASEKCFFLFPVEGAVHLGGSGTNLYFTSNGEVPRGNFSFWHHIDIYSSDLLASNIGWRPKQLPGCSAPLSCHGQTSSPWTWILHKGSHSRNSVALKNSDGSLQNKQGPVITGSCVDNHLPSVQDTTCSKWRSGWQERHNFRPFYSKRARIATGVTLRILLKQLEWKILRNTTAQGKYAGNIDSNRSAGLASRCIWRNICVSCYEIIQWIASN
jgi:hypothetical protein